MKGGYDLFKMAMGIYKITNVVNCKIYVGSTTNFDKREEKHLYMLNNDKHINKRLQEDWNKCGQFAFTFRIIEIITDKDCLNEREIYWIRELKTENSNYGYNFPIRSRKLTIKDVVKIKKRIIDGECVNTLANEFGVSVSTINDIKYERIWTNISPRLSRDIARHNTKQNRAKSNNHTKAKKLDIKKVKEIKKMIDDEIPHKTIAEIFNVSRPMISNIKRGLSWNDVVKD